MPDASASATKMCPFGVPSATAAQAVRRRQGTVQLPRASAPSKLQADLTVKLRAMDLALEQIEHARGLPAERFSAEEQHVQSVATLVEDCLTRTTQKIETLENDLNNLRSHVSFEIESLSQQGLEGQKHFASEQKFSDFQAELTTALEQHLGDAEILLEKRLQEVRSEVLEAMAGSEAVAKESSTRVANLGSSMNDRVDQLERLLQGEKLRFSEASQSFSETMESLKSQSGKIQNQLQLLQDEVQFSKEQFQSCRVHAQKLHESGDEIQMELSLVRQRLQLLQEEVFTVMPDLEWRNQKLEDGLRQEMREMEARLTPQSQKAENDLRHVEASASIASKRSLEPDPVLRKLSEIDVPALQQRLVEFQLYWPGSLQAEHSHLDEVRRGIDVQLKLVGDRIDILEIQQAQRNHEAHVGSGEVAAGHVAKLHQLEERVEQAEKVLTETQSVWQAHADKLSQATSQLASAPWCRAIADLECELKALMAGQVEASSASSPLMQPAPG